MIWSGRGAVKGEACEAHDQQGGFVEPLLGVSGLVFGVFLVGNDVDNGQEASNRFVDCFSHLLEFREQLGRGCSGIVKGGI